jgi:CheY-like chemotaxis protein
MHLDEVAFRPVPDEKREDSRGTVLVVDDDGDFLDAVRSVIEEEGFRVLTAKDGKEAFDVLGDHETPCLILLDLRMPGMDGPEFRRRQLADPRIAGIPVVGFTGLSNGDGEARLLALSSYLRKPVHLHQLLETVAHYCSDPDHLDGFTPPSSSER